MRSRDAVFLAILIVTTARPALPEITISQGVASWSNDERTPIRKTPPLTVIAPIPASIDPARVEFAEITCFASASRNAGERTVRGARGRYVTYAYSLDETTGSFEKVVLDSGEIKTAKNGQAGWAAQISTATLPGSLKWSRSELTWTNSRKVEFTFLGCFLIDEDNLDQRTH